MRKKPASVLAAGSLMLAAAGPAMAIDIGGLEIPLGPVFSAGQIYSSPPTAVGQQLTAYGKVDSINSVSIGDLCTDCELTFRVSDYVVSSISPTGVTTTGGKIEFYLGTGADKDFSTTNAGGLASDISEATNGTLFMTLTGREVDGSTFVSVGQNIGTAAGVAFGSGLADVDTSAGGIANSTFDTNTINGADVQLNASWGGLNPLYQGQGACGDIGCLRGSADIHAVAVPEPETYALMLSALGLIGWVVHRRRRV